MTFYSWDKNKLIWKKKKLLEGQSILEKKEIFLLFKSEKRPDDIGRE
jgi:hypothetical protein